VYEQKTCKKDSQETSCQKNREKSAGEKNCKKTKRKKKINSKAHAQREILERELKNLIPEIDEEGLAFLLKQAQVSIHNLNVDRVNKELEQARQSGKQVIVKNGKAEAVKGQSGVWIEDAPGSTSFIVVLGSIRKIFSREELRKLVAIAHSGSDDGARSEQLYTWFKKHRGDVLFDVKIGAQRHPLLFNLARYLRTHYKVR
jgi:hypothetical protein